jgi:hypothetical protein
MSSSLIKVESTNFSLMLFNNTHVEACTLERFNPIYELAFHYC